MIKDGLEKRASTKQSSMGGDNMILRTHHVCTKKLVAAGALSHAGKKRNPTNNQKLIEKLKQEIDKAQNDDSISTEEELELKWKLCEAYREEELFWKQKSRTMWLREGDRNTKFFHAKTKQRRARNRITKLLDSMGNWVESEEGIEALASEYFANLFTASVPQDREEAFRFTTAKVSQEMNEMLIREPTDVEIRKAMFAIHPEKAPGPDGMTSLFYQRFWKLIGPDIVRMVKAFFNSGELDERINQTNMLDTKDGETKSYDRIPAYQPMQR